MTKTWIKETEKDTELQIAHYDIKEMIAFRNKLEKLKCIQENSMKKVYVPMYIKNPIKKDIGALWSKERKENLGKRMCSRMTHLGKKFKTFVRKCKYIIGVSVNDTSKDNS